MASDPQDPPPEATVGERDDHGVIMTEALRQEDEFLEYLMSFPRTEPRPSVPSEPSDSQPNVGLDHLDNLCKLMEQLGELREQNCKLHKRVQYLEDLRALQDMHRQLKARVQRQSSEDCLRDVVTGASSGGVTNGKDNKLNKLNLEECLLDESKTKSSLHHTQSFHLRERSRSVGPEELPIPPKAKVSKWTRVKEAFRWEKAQLDPVSLPNAGPQLPEAKSQDSGIGLGQDPARSALLQVPGSRTIESVSPADSVLSYSAPMSSSSSSEDLMDIDLDFAALSEATEFTSGPMRSASAAADSSGDRPHVDRGRRQSLSPGPEDEAARRSKSLESGGAEDGCKLDKKASKTPWGKVKNIIQTRRDSLKRRDPPRPGFSDDEGDEEQLPVPRGQRSREPSGDKRPPILTITLPSTEELHPPPRQVKPPQSPQPEERVPRSSRVSELQLGARPKDNFRRQSSLPRPSASAQLSGSSPPAHRRPSKWTKVKKAFLTSRREEELSNLTISMPCTPHSGAPGAAFQFERASLSQTHAEIQRNYEELQSRLSQEFHKKLGEWERRKSNVGQVPTASGAPGEEEQLSADFRKKLHEWEKIKSGAKEEEVQPPPPPPPPMPPPPPVHYHLSPQFRKRLLEWQIRRAVAGKAGPHEEHELHRELPEDFARKLQQWERIKAGKTSPRLTRKDSRTEQQKEASGSNTSSPHDKSKIAHKEKQLQWLEKELNKVEREKRRLEREREKFLEREARLERMRRAMKSPDSSGEQEVLIQTSTGFFRFHGISEQFTKRLYEWEQQRGIAPEASTFALLDPKFRPEGGEEGAAGDADLGSPPSGTLVRCKSVGSVAEMAGTPATIGAELVQSQPSSLSLNDVEALEAELEETRVASEPRLRTDSHSRPRADSRSKPRSRSNSRSAPRGRPPPTLPSAPALLPLPLHEGGESPGAVIVDVEDEVEETAPLVLIPVVRSETPVWSYATSEVTSLSHATSSSEGRQRPVKRGDSVRSYQLLEENMQLLGELKEKEAICRQLEAEMEQLERKLQDVAATQHRQLERLKIEETDRTDDDDEQQATPALSEERVSRLRRSVVELGARRERLQRQGQALQDSFAQAWQQQAALAQSLVGRMRLLRRGVAEDSPDSHCVPGGPAWRDAACPAVAFAPEAGTPCQDPVAKVEHLSTQLLMLAEKLEQALSSRTREIQNLRCELLRGTTGGGLGLWPPPGAEGHLSASLNSLQTGDRASRSPLLPRQSSEELAELPLLLTRKVLELQRGLGDLCAAAAREAESNPEGLHDRPDKNVDFKIEEQTEDIAAEETDTPTATFVLRVGGRKRGPSEVTSATPLPQIEPDVCSTPVTSLTICPAFWKRVPVVEPDQGRRSPDDTSFCSALSSSESEREEEEEEKSDEGSDTNRHRLVKEHIVRSRTTGSILKEKDEIRESMSPQNGSNQNLRRCSLRRSKHISEENRELWRQHQYVTTVSATATTAEAKKLKTRRVSDTHVAYKSQEGGGRKKSNTEPSSPINVFVPTTRKIFSPIQGKTESIIGYVVSDSSGNIPEKTAEIPVITPWRRRGSTESENSKTVETCVIPWRRTRDSQSASPALPRKILAGSFSPESSPRARRILNEAGKNDWPSSPLPPPFPRSPTPNRRAELKQTKEAAPSIKLMIAKYNQKLAELPSPEIRSPTCSPAWRSPVAERRDTSGMVRVQMEKYQEEVKRALQQGFSATRWPVGSAVQKSASAGAIRSPSTTKVQPTPPTPLLKSSSAGAIKSPLLPIKKIEKNLNSDFKITSSDKLIFDTPPSPLDQSIDFTIQTYRKNPASPRQHSSRTPHSPCLRALKLKRAKEEFLSRGPGGLSTTEAGCRLSQASAGSGSSFEDLLVNNEGIVKSASAGMIHVQASVYKRLAEPQKQELQSKSTVDIKPEPKSKFGLSGLASKFRKVRLRKKERLNTVSLLCRQSLLVDLNDSRPNQSNASVCQSTTTLGPSTSSVGGGKESISCPSSPVLGHKSTWPKKNINKPK